jgi:signal transduction histidine kinase
MQLPGAGLGLAGMRERLRLYGATVDAGPVGANFQVKARIPRSDAVTADDRPS